MLYSVLAKVYYMPDYKSKACTKDYLLKYCFASKQIFVMKKDDITHHHFRYRKHASLELLELLENKLKEKSRPPTGLDVSTLQIESGCSMHSYFSSQMILWNYWNKRRGKWRIYLSIFHVMKILLVCLLYLGFNSFIITLINMTSSFCPTSSALL